MCRGLFSNVPESLHSPRVSGTDQPEPSISPESADGGAGAEFDDRVQRIEEDLALIKAELRALASELGTPALSPGTA